MSVAFRTLGTSWGVIRNLADTPLFVDSRASRVIQLVDRRAARSLANLSQLTPLGPVRA